MQLLLKVIILHFPIFSPFLKTDIKPRDWRFRNVEMKKKISFIRKFTLEQGGNMY